MITVTDPVIYVDWQCALLVTPYSVHRCYVCVSRREILFDKQCGYVHPVLLLKTLTASLFWFGFDLGNEVHIIPQRLL